uniref:Drought induced 19 protein type zinc-binding domain-containing protein n=1 Tax=Oryza meridionalis TaxID=40149 RepID=A0A0E0DQF7_9ORYZ
MVHATPGPPTIAVLSSSHRPQRPTTTTRARSHRHTRTHSTTQRRKRERERESKKGRENRHHRERGKRGTKEGSAARLEARVSIRFDSAAAAAMDAGDAWGRSSSSSSSAAAAAAARRLQSRYDLYMGFDDADAAGVEEVEARGGGEAYNCPFCGEDFDFVAFCCHVDDEHAVEAKSGVCPICATRVGVDLIGHLTMQHGNDKTVERAEPSLSEKDQKERAQRSKFVRGLVLSTILEDDNL